MLVLLSVASDPPLLRVLIDMDWIPPFASLLLSDYILQRANDVASIPLSLLILKDCSLRQYSWSHLGHYWAI